MFAGRLPPPLCLVLLLAACPPLPAAGPPARPTPASTAARVDDALKRALGQGVTLPPRVDDETFLRRACLDLTGKLPTDAEARAFAADPDRGRLVERLLQSDAHAVNWGR